AGLIGAFVLWTMPGFALLAHQAMTDMPLVACVGASLGLLLRALSTNDAVLVGRYVVRVFGRDVELHAGHALALLIAIVTFSEIPVLVLGPVRVWAGSPGICGVPGQPPCTVSAIAHPRLTPGVQGALWIPLASSLVLHVGGEQRVARLAAIGAW